MWADDKRKGLDLAEFGMWLKEAILKDNSRLARFAQQTIDSHDSRGAALSGKVDRDLPPLPVEIETAEEAEWRAYKDTSKDKLGRQADVPGGTKEVLRLGAGIKSWVFLVTMLINFLYCCRGSATEEREAKMYTGPASAAQTHALAGLQQRVAFFIGESPGRVQELDWVDRMVQKAVSYTGEEIGVAQPLTWNQLLPALPPKGSAGIVRAEELASGGVREALLNPTLCFKNESEWPEAPSTAKIRASPKEWKVIAPGLVEHGVCGLVRASEVLKCNGSNVLNGMFGVGKGDLLDDGSEVLRLIMNLIPSNELQRVICGDVATLPYIGSWGAAQICAHEVLLWSSEDIRCMFYIFRLPDVWKPYLAFGEALDGSHFGLAPGELWHLCSLCPPMGWISAVGVCQHLHRRLLLASTSRGAGLPPLREARKDRPFPGSGDHPQVSWWQTYIDNFDRGLVIALATRRR